VSAAAIDLPLNARRSPTPRPPANARATHHGAGTPTHHARPPAESLVKPAPPCSSERKTAQVAEIVAASSREVELTAGTVDVIYRET